MPVIELFSVAASDAYVNDQSVLQSAIDVLKGTAGCQEIFFGLQEGENTLWLAIVWESYESHKALIDNKDVYGPLIPDFKACWAKDGVPRMHHVTFHKDPVPAFEAGSTQILTITPNKSALPGVNQSYDALRGLLEIVWARLTLEEDLLSVPTVGTTREDENCYVVVNGWTKQEARIKFAQNAPPELKQTVAALHAAFDVNMVHVKFVKY